jgi:hypothetical protein
MFKQVESTSIAQPVLVDLSRYTPTERQHATDMAGAPRYGLTLVGLSAYRDVSIGICTSVIQPSLTSTLTPSTLNAQPQRDLFTTQPRDHLNLIFGMLHPKAITRLSRMNRAMRHHVKLYTMRHQTEFFRATYDTYAKDLVLHELTRALFQKYPVSTYAPTFHSWLPFYQLTELVIDSDLARCGVYELPRVIKLTCNTSHLSHLRVKHPIDLTLTDTNEWLQLVTGWKLRRFSSKRTLLQYELDALDAMDTLEFINIVTEAYPAMEPHAEDADVLRGVFPAVQWMRKADLPRKPMHLAVMHPTDVKYNEFVRQLTILGSSHPIDLRGLNVAHYVDCVCREVCYSDQKSIDINDIYMGVSHARNAYKLPATLQTLRYRGSRTEISVLNQWVTISDSGKILFHYLPNLRELTLDSPITPETFEQLVGYVRVLDVIVRADIADNVAMRFDRLTIRGNGYKITYTALD